MSGSGLSLCHSPSSTACSCWAEQINSNVAELIHTPVHLGHSTMAVSCRSFCSIAAEQRGHFAPTATLVIGTVSGLPQCEQNFAPRKFSPKQEGQEIVASFAPQYWHCVASDETAPPQLGQLSVP